MAEDKTPPELRQELEVRRVAREQALAHPAFAEVRVQESQKPVIPEPEIVAVHSAAEAQRVGASLPDLPTGIGRGWLHRERSEDDPSDLWLRWDPKEFITVRVTSPEPFNYEGHWVPALGTYRRCTAPRCPYCPPPQAEQQRGGLYASETRDRHLLAVEVEAGAQRIWEFSPKMATRLEILTLPFIDGIITTPRPLRGLVLVLGREGRRKNGEVWCEPHENQVATRPVPEPIDVPGYLAQTWRRAAIRDGKALAVSRAAPPAGDGEHPIGF